MFGPFFLNPKFQAQSRYATFAKLTKKPSIELCRHNYLSFILYYCFIGCLVISKIPPTQKTPKANFHGDTRDTPIIDCDSMFSRSLYFFAFAIEAGPIATAWAVLHTSPVLVEVVVATA